MCEGELDLQTGASANGDDHTLTCDSCLLSEAKRRLKTCQYVSGIGGTPGLISHNGVELDLILSFS